MAINLLYQGVIEGINCRSVPRSGEPTVLTIDHCDIDECTKVGPDIVSLAYHPGPTSSEGIKDESWLNRRVLFNIGVVAGKRLTAFRPSGPPERGIDLRRNICRPTNLSLMSTLRAITWRQNFEKSCDKNISKLTSVGREENEQKYFWQGRRDKIQMLETLLDGFSSTEPIAVKIQGIVDLVGCSGRLDIRTEDNELIKIHYSKKM